MSKMIVAIFIGAVMLILFGCWIQWASYQNNIKHRIQCNDKGGVWWSAEQVCLKLETIPVPE